MTVSLQLMQLMGLWDHLLGQTTVSCSSGSPAPHCVQGLGLACCRERDWRSRGRHFTHRLLASLFSTYSQEAEEPKVASEYHWKCQTSSCACFSYCCLKVNNYHVRKPQGRLIFILLPCHTPVPPPSLSSPAQPPVPLPSHPHPVPTCGLICLVQQKRSSKLSKKKLSPANITPQGHKASCYRALQVSVLQVPRAAPTQTPRDPHPSARHPWQPLPFPGSSQCCSDPLPRASFTAPASFRLKKTLHHRARFVGVFSLSGFQLVSWGAISHLAAPAGAEDELI